MFTGIVTAIGQIESVAPLGGSQAHGLRLTVRAPGGYLADVGTGDSIALDGACMTVTGLDAALGTFSIDVSAESLARTASLSQPGPVNLEKALRAHDRLGGHIVAGHVDAVGEVVRLSPTGESQELRVLAPRALARYLASKGSVTVNGVSLTVNTVADGPQGCEFAINVIPHTTRNTTLGRLEAGSKVNLEIDLIARYVERMLREAPAAQSQTS